MDLSLNIRNVFRDEKGGWVGKDHGAVGDEADEGCGREKTQADNESVL